MTATVGEVILEAASKETEEEQAKVFINHHRLYGKDDALQLCLKYIFHKDFVFNLPEGTPPFKDQDLPDGLGDTNLRMESRRLYLFQKGNPTSDALKPERRETLFVQLLEGLARSDQKTLLLMKDKIQTNLKESVIRKLYPGLLPEEVKEAPKEEKEPAKKDTKKKAAKKKTKKKAKKAASKVEHTTTGSVLDDLGLSPEETTEIKREAKTKEQNEKTEEREEAETKEDESSQEAETTQES